MFVRLFSGGRGGNLKKSIPFEDSLGITYGGKTNKSNMYIVHVVAFYTCRLHAISFLAKFQLKIFHRHRHRHRHPCPVHFCKNEKVEEKNYLKIEKLKFKKEKN